MRMTLTEAEAQNRKFDVAGRTICGSVTRTGENRVVAASGSATPERDRPSDDPESKLHDFILEYANARGWLAIHSRMDRPTTTACGVSDFIIVTPQNVYFLECKRPGNKPTPKQQAFLAAVRVLGWPQAVVHSRDEFLEFIQGRQ